MGKVLTALGGLLVSTVLGAAMAQQFAAFMQAGEEFILVFAMLLVIALLVAVALLAAQFRREPLAAVDRVGTRAATLLVLTTVVLVLWSMWDAGGRLDKGDVEIFAGIALPGLVVVFVQWLFVRWLASRRAAVLKTPAA